MNTKVCVKNVHQIKSSILFAHQFLKAKSFVKEARFKAIFKEGSNSHGMLNQGQVIQKVFRKIVDFK